MSDSIGLMAFKSGFVCDLVESARTEDDDLKSYYESIHSEKSIKKLTIDNERLKNSFNEFAINHKNTELYAVLKDYATNRMA